MNHPSTICVLPTTKLASFSPARGNEGCASRRELIHIHGVCSTYFPPCQSWTSQFLRVLLQLSSEISCTSFCKVPSRWREMHTIRTALGVTLDLPCYIVERADRREADEGSDVSSSHGAILIWGVVMYYTAFSIIVLTCKTYSLKMAVKYSVSRYNDCGRTKGETSASTAPKIRPSKSSWEFVRLCKSAATAGPVAFSESSSI